MKTALISVTVLMLTVTTVGGDETRPWVEKMKQVHANFTGKPGTLALFGDSITLSKAFWSPLAYAPRDLPTAVSQDLHLVRRYMLEDCWSKWRGPDFGNESGKMTRWAEENCDAWLKKLNPETVVVMFGTNDLTQIDAREYEMRTRTLIEKCLRNGSVVILTTIPPRGGAVEEKSKEFAAVQRRIAADLKLPLIDYQGEILKRRPTDWNGGLPQFKAEASKDAYSVPTLIAADGVHPSFPSKYQDYSEESLSRNGYQLRTVMTLNMYAEVIRLVLAPEKK